MSSERRRPTPNSTDAPSSRAAREDARPVARPYAKPRLNAYGTLGALTGTSKPKGRVDKTSRRTGF